MSKETETLEHITKEEVFFPSLSMLLYLFAEAQIILGMSLP